MIFFVILAVFSASASAKDAVPRKTQSPVQVEAATEAQRLGEANRVLEEELKLAGRQQIYLFLDLPDRLLLLKSRGLELHRVAILHAESVTDRALARTFRLEARPSVSRPKAAAGEDPSEPVIELDDMPAEYALHFDPNLLVLVSPPAHEQPWLWMRSRLREWGNMFVTWFKSIFSRHAVTPVRIRITMNKEEARSLAWSVVEGMPLLVHNAAWPKGGSGSLPKETGETRAGKATPPEPSAATSATPEREPLQEEPSPSTPNESEAPTSPPSSTEEPEPKPEPSVPSPQQTAPL